MSIRIGKKKNMRMSKYILFEIFSYVYQDYQSIQIIMKMGKEGARLVLKNRELLFKIHELSNQSSAIDFKMNDGLGLDLVDLSHLNSVNFLRLNGPINF